MSTEMSSTERWETLTRTGPGTPAGELLRRYWQPVAFMHEFPIGSGPRHHRIFSEDLVLFRDQEGQPGLLGLHCPHRNADLSYGRIEDGGLRCPYHGWLFNVHGDCLEQANLARDQQNAGSIKQKAYPCIERGGVVWTYMGPGAPPSLPDYPFLNAPEGHRYCWRWRSNCNFLQANEGNLDPSHLSFLHSQDVSLVREDRRAGMNMYQIDRAPRISVVETTYGLRLLAERKVPGQGKKWLRASNFILPNAASANGYETALGLGGCSMMWHVPIDDHSSWRFEIMFHAKKKLPIDDLERERVAEQDINFESKRSEANRYMQDRDEMTRTFIGLGQTFPVHDLFVTESQGSISDHRNEHLVASDVAIGRSRREILNAIAAVQAGRDPKGVVRTEGPSFTDFVTFTDTIDESADSASHANDMAVRRIYDVTSVSASREPAFSERNL